MEKDLVKVLKVCQSRNRIGRLIFMVEGFNEPCRSRLVSTVVLSCIHQQVDQTALFANMWGDKSALNRKEMCI